MKEAMKKWFENNISLIADAVIALIIALIILWVYMQLQYCGCHPDEEWCQMKNATSIVNLVVR